MKSFSLYSILLILLAGSLSGQDYLLELSEPGKYATQQITHFGNGDLLVANSSIEALQSGGGGTIYLTRLDVCGNTSWSAAYHREEEYMEIKDVLLNEAGEIFVYGSAYIGLDELIFLLKVDESGHVLRFQMFEPETVDHFTFNIDLRDGVLMAYGLILDFNTKKFGFLAVFSENLSFLWGVKFTPFESFGEARIISGGHFLCRSGPYLIKLSPEGQWEWGRTLQTDVPQIAIAGPLEVEGGYILQARSDDTAFFYKVSTDGDLVWVSDRFPTKAIGADLARLDNGQILATYSTPADGMSQLAYLRLSSAGEIIDGRVLQMEKSTNPGKTYQSTGRQDRRVIAVNADRFTIGDTDLPAFLLQMQWPPIPNDCFNWTSIPASQFEPNEVEVMLEPLDTTTEVTTLTPARSTLISELDFSSPYLDACDDGPGTELILIDTLLDCNEDWLVDLPGPEYQWTDGYPEFSRLISEPGTYQARNEDCGDLALYDYTLNRPPCPCPIFLPNAFSPNGDGNNDFYVCYPGCVLGKLRMRIFNRWGTLVYEASTPAAAWDGNHQGRPADSGIYLVLADYAWRDHTGQLQSASISQEFTLMR